MLFTYSWRVEWLCYVVSNNNGLKVPKVSNVLGFLELINIFNYLKNLQVPVAAD